MHQDYRISIPTQLRSYTGGAADVSVAVAGPEPRLADVFAALDAAYPGIRFRMVDEQDRLRPNMRVFVNGKAICDLANPLQPSDDVSIVQALSGG